MENNKIQKVEKRQSLTLFCNDLVKSYEEIIVSKPETAIFNETPSLVKIKAEIGSEKLLIFLMDIIGRTVKYFSIGKSMSVEQTKQTAELIIQEFWYMKPSELKYCFNRGKMGVYGRIYDRIDGGVFFDWLNQYLIERQETCIAHREKQSSEYKSEEYKKKSNEAILPALKKAAEDMKTKPVPKPLNVTKLKDYDLHQEWFKEWDKINKVDDAERFGDYNGKILSQEEFIEVKTDEYNKPNN